MPFFSKREAAPGVQAPPDESGPAEVRARAADCARRELRALAALLASTNGGSPVCAALLRAREALAWLDTATSSPAADLALEPGTPASCTPGRAPPWSEEEGRALIAAATIPEGSSADPPSVAALLRYRDALLVWADELSARMRGAPGRRLLSARAWLTLGAVVTLGALTVGHRSPVWRVEYFQTRELTDPVASDLTVALGGNWGPDAPHALVPKDNFSSRWETCLTLPHTAKATFRLASEAGSRLFIDDRPVIVQWQTHSYTEQTATTLLAAGHHAVRVEHFDASGRAELSLRAGFDGHDALEPLPSRMLRAPGRGVNPCSR
jgi:hypothetical protein